MHPIDAGVIVAYLAGTLPFGSWCAASQRTVRDHFVVAHEVPWWAIAGERRSESHYLRVSRTMTAGWGVLQIGVALLAFHWSSRVVDEVLGIASFTNGGILGIFLPGAFAPRVGHRAAFAGAFVGAAVMFSVKLFTGVTWQWYVLIGSTSTYAAGWIANRLGLDRADSATSGGAT